MEASSNALVYREFMAKKIQMVSRKLLDDIAKRFLIKRQV
jgi:hypothetical protein